MILVHEYVQVSMLPSSLHIQLSSMQITAVMKQQLADVLVVVLRSALLLGFIELLWFSLERNLLIDGYKFR